MSDPSPVHPIFSRCADCESPFYPPQDVCPACWSTRQFTERASEGVAYACSTVDRMPPGFPSPSTIGYVDFPGQVRIFGHFDQLGDPIHPGDPVKATLRDVAFPDGAAPVLGVCFTASSLSRQEAPA